MEVRSGAEKAKFCHDMVAVNLGMWGYKMRFTGLQTKTQANST